MHECNHRGARRAASRFVPIRCDEATLPGAGGSAGFHAVAALTARRNRAGQVGDRGGRVRRAAKRDVGGGLSELGREQRADGLAAAPTAAAPSTSLFGGSGPAPGLAQTRSLTSAARFKFGGSGNTSPCRGQQRVLWRRGDARGQDASPPRVPPLSAGRCGSRNALTMRISASFGAAGVGFEPTAPFRTRRFSRRVRSGLAKPVLAGARQNARQPCQSRFARLAVCARVCA